jgi:hypothetical protein
MSQLLYLSQLESLEPDDVIFFLYSVTVDSSSVGLFSMMFPHLTGSRSPGVLDSNSTLIGGERTEPVSLNRDQVTKLQRSFPKRSMARFRIENIVSSDNQIILGEKKYIVEMELVSLTNYFRLTDTVEINEPTTGKLIFQYTGAQDRICLDLYWKDFRTEVYVEKKYVPKPKIQWRQLINPLMKVGDTFFAEYFFRVTPESCDLYKIFVSDDRDFDIRRGWMKPPRLTQRESGRLVDTLQKLGYVCNEREEFLARFFGQVKSVSSDIWYTARLFLPEIHEGGTSQKDVDFRLENVNGKILMVGWEGIPCQFTSPIYVG